MSDATWTADGAPASGKGIALNETERLISADKVEGTPVYNRAGQHIGSVTALMVDKVSGRMSYAVMAFGGFLGIGERYHPLPWQALDFDPRVGGCVADVTREQLQRAPSCASDETPWDNPGYGRSIYDCYGMACPYAGV